MADADGSKARLPAGVAAVVTTALAALPVWFWDDLENLGEGGPTNLLLPLALFAAAWAAAVPVLSLARHPRAEGAMAGGLVAVLILILVARIVATLDGDGPMWPLIPIVGLPFCALALGLGTAAGAVASRVSRSGDARGSRVAGIVCIVAGVVVFAVTAAFFLPLFSFLYFVPAVFAASLIAVGVWQVKRTDALVPKAD